MAQSRWSNLGILRRDGLLGPVDLVQKGGGRANLTALITLGEGTLLDLLLQPPQQKWQLDAKQAEKVKDSFVSTLVHGTQRRH